MVGTSIGPKEKDEIISALKGLKLTPKQENINFRLSAEAQNRINDFIYPLNKGVEAHIKSLWEDVQTFLLEEIKNQHLYQIKATLKDLSQLLPALAGSS